MNKQSSRITDYTPNWKIHKTTVIITSKEREREPLYCSPLNKSFETNAGKIFFQLMKTLGKIHYTE